MGLRWPGHVFCLKLGGTFYHCGLLWPRRSKGMGGLSASQQEPRTSGESPPLQGAAGSRHIPQAPPLHCPGVTPGLPRLRLGTGVLQRGGLCSLIAPPPPQCLREPAFQEKQEQVSSATVEMTQMPSFYKISIELCNRPFVCS